MNKKPTDFVSIMSNTFGPYNKVAICQKGIIFLKAPDRDANNMNMIIKMKILTMNRQMNTDKIKKQTVTTKK